MNQYEAPTMQNCFCTHAVLRAGHVHLLLHQVTFLPFLCRHVCMLNAAAFPCRCRWRQLGRPNHADKGEMAFEDHC